MIQKKIALIGTSCVGKTSILEILKEKFPEHVFINEAAREYFRSKRLSNRFSFSDQKNIQDLVIEKEKIMEGDMRICDRSVICPIIYTITAGDVKGGNLLHSRIKSWIKTYTEFLLLDPLGIPFENDEIRNEDIGFRMKVHNEYVAFLKKNNIQYTLINGSWKERVEKIETIIKLNTYA